MRFLFSFVFVLGLSLPLWAEDAGRSVSGSTYFFRHRLPALAGLSCADSLPKFLETLFGEQREHQHLAIYSQVLCSNDPEAPLEAEVLFEPSTEEDRGELENWMQSLWAQTWEGESLAAKQVTSIFWDAYGAAFKADQTYIGTFENPRIAANFADVLAAKSAAKAALVDPKVTFFWDYLNSQLGAKEFARWQKEVLPVTAQFSLQFAIYYVMSDQSVERAGVNYILSRDCSKLDCR